MRINQKMGYKFTENRANKDEVYEHLVKCNNSFIPALNTRADINLYAEKIVNAAVRFEAWFDDKLVGLVAIYLNDGARKVAYVTNVSIEPDHTGRGLAKKLVSNSIKRAYKLSFEQVQLEVSTNNQPAVNLYKGLGFKKIEDTTGESYKLALKLNDISMQQVKRDYDKEIKDTKDHRYAYNFDFDVMHPFMVRSFKPFFKTGNALELGSFKGDFTRRLLPFFSDITCVEASGEAIGHAKAEFGDRVKFIHALFEEVKLPLKYDNIILTHVLEHLDDPVGVMKRVNDEWLTDTGKFFLVCPNANAPSRQIAVKMGLITHNSAITPAEKEHGHRITYTLDTLERDAKAAGLKIVYRSGIFFKALANFQWDRLLNTDIISKEYLEGCYQLGQVYPDLCASIFLLCEKGDAR